MVCTEESLHFRRGYLVTAGGPGVTPDAPNAWALAWEAQDREFLAAVREGRVPSSSGAEALPALAALQQVQDHFVQP